MATVIPATRSSLNDSPLYPLNQSRNGKIFARNISVGSFSRGLISVDSKKTIYIYGLNDDSVRIALAIGSAEVAIRQVFFIT